MAAEPQESGTTVRITTGAKVKLENFLASGIRPSQQAVLSALIEWFVDLEDPTVQMLILDSVTREDRADIIQVAMRRMKEMEGAEEYKGWRDKKAAKKGPRPPSE